MLRDYRKEQFDIIIQAGQSNSSGTGYGLIEEPYIPTEKVWYMNGDFSVSKAVEEVCGNEIKSTFALSFAREYVNTGLLKDNRKLLILRAAVGGTGFLDKRWGMKDDLYLRMMKMTYTALQLNSQNRLVCMLWHQGETDAANQASYEVHYKHLMTLLKSVRKEFNVPELPFIAGDFVKHYREQNVEKCIPVISAIRDVCSDCGHGGFVETDGLLSNAQERKFDITICESHANDPYHFSRRSCYELGKRYFEVYLGLQNDMELKG